MYLFVGGAPFETLVSQNASAGVRDTQSMRISPAVCWVRHSWGSVDTDHRKVLGFGRRHHEDGGAVPNFCKRKIIIAMMFLRSLQAQDHIFLYIIIPLKI